MINFELHEKNTKEWAKVFSQMKPFPMIVIDNFADSEMLESALYCLPDPAHTFAKKSRDYIFAKNKFERSNFRELCPELNELFSDLVSNRFRKLLEDITGEKVFVDPKFHGGGLHQGGAGSYLNMHADFNYHPLNTTWFRNLNILLYLNKDWQPKYGGELRLRHKDTGEAAIIEPLFNRCVIMLTRDYTLHGYDAISFPEDQYRRSIAAYAYSVEEGAENHPHRSTTWYPDNGGFIKKAIGRHWPTLVRIKNRFFGSATEKNL